MEPENIKTWLQVAIAVPGLFIAWKIPKVIGWMKTKIATSLASAMMLQLSPTLQRMQSGIDEVRKQVFPNGGGSMNDKLGDVLQHARRTEHSVGVLHSTMRAHQDADLANARFETDMEFGFDWVSHVFLRWCNRGIDSIRGRGWYNCIAFHDRDRVRDEWETCTEEGREFSMRFSLMSVTGEEFPVEVFAKPIRAIGSADVDRYAGVFIRLA